MMLMHGIKEKNADTFGSCPTHKLTNNKQTTDDKRGITTTRPAIINHALSSSFLRFHNASTYRVKAVATKLPAPPLLLMLLPPFPLLLLP